MGDEPHRSPRAESRSAGVQHWVLLGSVLANVALAFWLLYPAVSENKSPASELRANGLPPESVAVARVNRAGPRPKMTRPAPPFHWSDLESTSYAEYMARLRGVGCPESVIRDIITADIGQHFAGRARQIWSPPQHEYWRKARETDRPNRDQIKQLMQLDAERQEVQKALLGSAVRQQEQIDLAFVQLHGPEQTLAWLPEDRRNAALAALEKAGYMAEEEKRMLTAQGGDSFDTMRELEKKQAQILEGVLTPDELKEFQMRSSKEAGSLRRELHFFDATQAEFDALMELRGNMANDKSLPQDVYARKAAECAAANDLLGEERAAEYERTTDLFYVWSRQAAEHYGVPEETASQAWTVKRDIMSAASQIRQNSALSELEKKRRLTGLKEQATAQLNDILGAKAAGVARKGDGAWLEILAERTQP